MDASPTAIFDSLESAVRSYCRTWPKVFNRAVGSWLYDHDGNPYLDFFAGAGALNYGHNNPLIKKELLNYLQSDGVTHSLDMHTVAKGEFLSTFDELVLRPRNLDYRVQFPGPAGTNAVEAALKLARKVTGRREVIAFTNSFHGVTLGALAVTGSKLHRAGAGVPLPHVTMLPYASAYNATSSLTSARSLEGCDVPLQQVAAVILETVQGEGGINVAPFDWLRDLAEWSREREILLIIDDIQMGCGRTGPFFSFEPAGITPDIVCLSKSLSGYGMPMAATLIRPDLDIWEPGEHNGTFRGFNLAFVTGVAALRLYWGSRALEDATLAKGGRLADGLSQIAQSVTHTTLQSRGRGLAQALAFEDPSLAPKVSWAAFERGLLVETAGPDNEVIKLLPALTASEMEIDRGLSILADAVYSTC